MSGLKTKLIVCGSKEKRNSVVPKLLLIAYHLWVPYCHNVSPCSRKTRSSKYYSIKSLENQNWHNFDMNEMAVRNCNGHFQSQQGSTQKFRNLTRIGKIITVNKVF